MGTPSHVEEQPALLRFRGPHPIVQGILMRSALPARTVAVLASSALTAAVIAISAPAAHAAPVFVDADTVLHSYSYISNYNGGACVVTKTSGSPDTEVP